jgi:hypothetical protein
VTSASVSIKNYFSAEDMPDPLEFRYRKGQRVLVRIWGGDRYTGQVTARWIEPGTGSRRLYNVYCEEVNRSFVLLERRMRAA